MTTHEKHEENVRKLREMIKGIGFAMLTTIEDDGSLRSRPMVVSIANPIPLIISLSFLTFSSCFSWVVIVACSSRLSPICYENSWCQHYHNGDCAGLRQLASDEFV